MNAISLKKKLLGGGAWAFFGKVVTALTGLAVNALLARLLSPEEMGAYFLTLSLVSVFAIVSQVGLTQATVRLVAESMGTGDPGRARQAVLWVLRIGGIAALLSTCFLILGGGEWIAGQLFHSTLMAKITGLIAVWVALLTFQGLLTEVYRGFHDIRLATVFGGMITGFLSMILFFGLWLFQGQSSLDEIILLTLIAGFSSIVLSSLVLRRRLLTLPKADDSQVRARDVLMISLPLWVTHLTLFVLTQADLWVLGIFSSQEIVAVYGAAARLVALVTMSLLIVNMIVPPVIAEMYALGKKEELEKILRTTATYAGFPALLMLILFILFGDSLLVLIFGGFYSEGGSVLAILSLGQIANVWAGSCGLTLMLTGHQSSMMYITIVCGSLTIVTALWLVQSYGGIGVACSAAGGLALQNFLMLLTAKLKVGVWTHFQLGLLQKSTK